MADLTERLGPSLYFPRVIEIVILKVKDFKTTSSPTAIPSNSAPRTAPDKYALTPRCNHQFADNLKATITFV
jgi:hypothetical protein